MKRNVLICTLLVVNVFIGDKMFAQEDVVLAIPISRGYSFYYDGNFHDYCGRTKYMELKFDTQNRIHLKENVCIDTLDLANDHYGQECFIYDAHIEGAKFFVNVYVPKNKSGYYEFKATPLECQLLEFAVSQVEGCGKMLFLLKHDSLNLSENSTCHDCDAISYIRLKKDSIYSEYLLHHLADSIPDALLFLRDAVGAVIDNHCRNSNVVSVPITDYSIRDRFIFEAVKSHCPLGLVGNALYHSTSLNKKRLGKRHNNN